MSEDTAIPMRVAAVVVDPKTQAPVLLLRGLSEPRLYLPIFVGTLEATAIATVLAGTELPRPMTHDLMVNVIGELGWELERITVTELRDGTFYALLTVSDDAGRERRIDARPSDSIALALRAGAPILVSREVLAEAGGMAEPDDEAEIPTSEATAPEAEPPTGSPVSPDTNLEDLDPEIFGKYKM